MSTVIEQREPGESHGAALRAAVVELIDERVKARSAAKGNTARAVKDRALARRLESMSLAEAVYAACFLEYKEAGALPFEPVAAYPTRHVARGIDAGAGLAGVGTEVEAAGSGALPGVLSTVAVPGVALDFDCRNAKATPLARLATTKVGDVTLAELARRHDPDLEALLLEDGEHGRAMLRTLAACDTHPPVRCDARLKQVYWRAGEDDGAYHLLVPLYPSSLVHATMDEFWACRMAEKDRREGKFNAHAAVRFVGDVTTTMGGSSPQNISLLTSQFGRGIHLLASLPPAPAMGFPDSLLGKPSALNCALRRAGATEQAGVLAATFAAGAASNKRTRDRRKNALESVAGALVAFCDDVRGTAVPGWTMQRRCRLPDFEQAWLDPERVELSPPNQRTPVDDAVAHLVGTGSWRKQLARAAAEWLLRDMADSHECAGLGDVELDLFTEAIEERL